MSRNISASSAADSHQLATDALLPNCEAAIPPCGSAIVNSVLTNKFRDFRKMPVTIRPCDTSVVFITSPGCPIAGGQSKAEKVLAIQKRDLLQRAAQLTDIPYWTLVCVDDLRKHQESELVQSSLPRIFSCDGKGIPGKAAAFRERYLAENRSRVLFCGFWLDAGLGASALEACVDGFDVHVVTDLTFSREPDHTGDVMRRLEQHGVVPVTLHQMIYEMMTWCGDDSTSNELYKLLEHEVFLNPNK